MGSGSSKSQGDAYKPKVVIVGAGYAGITLASELRGFCTVVLINPENFFMHNAGAPRSVVQPDFVKNILIPLEATFKDSYVQAKVVGIKKSSNTVVLDSGNEIGYTHLVLATGTYGPFPFRLCTNYPSVSLQKSFSLYEDLVNTVEKAPRITCIGGGAVGVELAGEIKHRYPHKKVTLVHSSKTLCTSRLTQSGQTKLQSCIRQKGIDLMLEEKVSNLNDLSFYQLHRDQTVKTESGKTWRSDLVFNCTGAQPASDMFRQDLGDSVITADGRIIVDQHFIVEGTTNIFAIGDVTNISEEKMVVTAQAHACLLAKNIKASFFGRKITPYKPGSFLMIVPVGKNSGVTQLYGIVFGDFITSIIKGKGLFVNKMWRLMKQTPGKDCC